MGSRRDRLVPQQLQSCVKSDITEIHMGHSNTNQEGHLPDLEVGEVLGKLHG